jgi:hypothetical protein
MDKVLKKVEIILICKWYFESRLYSFQIKAIYYSKTESGAGSIELTKKYDF